MRQSGGLEKTSETLPRQMKGLNPTSEYIALFAVGVCSIELSTREARANRLLGRARDDHVTRLPLLVDHDDDDIGEYHLFLLSP
jgi:hypothetical protein